METKELIPQRKTIMKYDYNICLICGKRKGSGGRYRKEHIECSKKLKALYDAKKTKIRGRVLLHAGDIR